MRFPRTVFAVLLVVVAVTSVAAQSGGLTVKVIDKAQNPLPGATVVLTNAIQLISETAAATDANGIVEFPVLRPGGGYIVQVTLPGYAGVRRDDIRVKISDTQTLVITLGEEITEVEKVVAKKDVVELEKSTTSTTFGDEFIQDLPVQGRLYTNILTLAPGVTDENNDGNPNVHGSRERDFATIVGGVPNVDPLTGLRLSNVNIDSIEEMEVITAGAGVEFGRAQGGFANVIEKQGSNEFEGLFTMIYRTSALDGDGATPVPGAPKPNFKWLQPAIQVSGPFVKDRLWYRFSEEYLKRQDPINTGSDLTVQTRTQTTSSNMVTWQASRRNKLAFSYLNAPLKVDNQGVTSTVPSSSSYTDEFSGPTYRLTWTAPYSPKLLVDSLVSYQDAGRKIYPTQEGVSNNCIEGLPIFQNARCTNLVTGLTSGSYYQNWSDSRQRLLTRTQADIFAGRFWGMSHQFKLGFEATNERYERTLNRGPLISFFEAGGDATSGFGRRGFVSARVSIPGSSTAKATGVNWAFYAEDQMKPTSNLSVTAGFRVDNESISSYGHLPFDPEAEATAFYDALPNSNNVNTLVNSSFTAYENIDDFILQLASLLNIPVESIANKVEGGANASKAWALRRRPDNIDIRNTNISPYLSVSWDPFKTGKTKFAAAVGRHYDKIFLAIPLVELEPVSTDLNFNAVNVGGVWRVDSVCGGDASCVSPTASVTTVDRNLRTPYQDEFTLSVEREIAAETRISLTFVKRKYRDQLQDIDLNHLPGDFGRCQLQTSPGVSPIVISPGSGQTYIDPFTGESYVDTDPGDGDGRMDDCTGKLIQNPNSSGNEPPPQGTPPAFAGFLVRPDGFPDAYVQNPGWGEVFLLGNFNTADYTGYTLELTRRQYRNWQMDASYTWSKVIGDAEDYNQFLGDDRTILKDERGYLDWDQRHSVKINATTIVPWAGGFRFGTAVSWQSGYPYTIFRQDVSIDSVPPQLSGSIASPESRVRWNYPTHRRNDQRNVSWWNFDVHLAKEFTLRGGMNMQVTADIFNLMNESHLRVYSQLNGFNGQVRQFGRRFQVGVRLAF